MFPKKYKDENDRNAKIYRFQLSFYNFVLTNFKKIKDGGVNGCDLRELRAPWFAGHTPGGPGHGGMRSSPHQGQYKLHVCRYAGTWSSSPHVSGTRTDSPSLMYARRGPGLSD